VHTQPEQELIFRTVFAWWIRFGGIFRRSLGATTKKVVNFFGKKVHPQRQNPGYAYALNVPIKQYCIVNYQPSNSQ